MKKFKSIGEVRAAVKEARWTQAAAAKALRDLEREAKLKAKPFQDEHRRAYNLIDKYVDAVAVVDGVVILDELGTLRDVARTRSAEIYLNQQNKTTYGLRIGDGGYPSGFCGKDWTKKAALAAAYAWIARGTHPEGP